MNKIISLFFIVFFISSTINAQEDKTPRTITTSVPFLLIGPDARAGAMGDAGVATSPDANSMHWNAAKFAFAEKDLGASFSFVPWLRSLVPDINLSYITGYAKLSDNQAVGFELGYFSLGEITFIDENKNELGQYKPNEYLLSGAYSRKLSDYFSLSITGKYIYSNLTGNQYVQNVPTKPGTSIAADLAGYYFVPIRIMQKDLDYSFGFNISNMGNKISYTNELNSDFIPINLRLGSAVGADIDDFNKIMITVDVNKLLVPTPPVYDPQTNEIISGKPDDVPVVEGMFQSFNDAPGGFSEEMREINYSLGTEYWYDNQFAVRGGYFHEHDTKGARKFFTFGAGVKYTMYTLDFSYLIDAKTTVGVPNPLANTMRFSMIFDFGAIENNSE